MMATCLQILQQRRSSKIMEAQFLQQHGLLQV
jgi:hypothetical protein